MSTFLLDSNGDDLDWFEWAEHTDFEGACFKGIDIPDIDLRTKSLCKSEWENCVFSKTDLRDTLWTEAKLNSVTFDECDLSDADLQSIEAKILIFKDCKLEGAMFNIAAIESLQMHGCEGQITMDFTNLEGAEFVECDLDRVSFDGADLTGAIFQDCFLERADFSRAILERACFIKSVLTDSRIAAAKNLDFVEFTGSIIDPFLVEDYKTSTQPNISYGGYGQVPAANLGIYKAPAKIAVLICSDEKELQQKEI